MIRVYLKNGEMLTIQATSYKTEIFQDGKFFLFFNSANQQLSLVWLPANEVACVIAASYLKPDSK